MPDQSVRVRFAPSPTGDLHIGSLRAALFNWLFARHHNGTYLVRIEDTDIKRSTPESVQAIIEGLSWTSLLPDQEIVYQSDFLEKHKALIKQLIDEGKAYRCYCPDMATQEGYIKYGAKCRIIDEPAGDTPYVVRLKVPDFASISFTDLIRGEITFARDQFDDFIIARSDGMPVYNFVVVVDDHAMGITHVIRGEDHISNTPKQLLLYQALGYAIPQFAHLPLILNEQGGKLSKRDAATSVIDYKKQGYLPDALCNYLVRLGWAHGDQELFSREELIKLFTLDGVGKKGAAFDSAKLNWINSSYLQNMEALVILNMIIADVEPNFLMMVKDFSPDQLVSLLDLYKMRVNTLRELVIEVQLLYEGPQGYDQEGIEKFTSDQTVELISLLVGELQSLTLFDAESIKQLIKQFAKQRSVKLPFIAQPIRLALVGAISSPGVFELMAAIHKELCIKRLQSFIAFLKKKYTSS